MKGFAIRWLLCHCVWNGPGWKHHDHNKCSYWHTFGIIWIKHIMYQFGWKQNHPTFFHVFHHPIFCKISAIVGWQIYNKHTSHTKECISLVDPVKKNGVQVRLPIWPQHWSNVELKISPSICRPSFCTIFIACNIMSLSKHVTCLVYLWSNSCGNSGCLNLLVHVH